MASPADLRLSPVSSLEDEHNAWGRLAERSGNIFSTWEWADAWWRAAGTGKRLALVAGRDPNGETAAILPFVLERLGPARMVRWLGHGQAQQLGPVCDPANMETVAKAIRRALHATLPRHDIFLCEEVPASQGWPRLLGAPLLLEAENPTLRIEAPDWESFLASRSANFREQVRRRERTLGRRYNLRFRLCDDEGRLQDDLTSLFGLHRARWHESGIDGFRGYREPLHRDFAARALERGWLRLWILELDGRAAAAWYGFRFGGAEWYYQAGRDPALERDAVGFVLMAHTVREAIRDGMREYRLLRGGQEYKYRFANADDTLQTVGLAGSLAGRAALIAGTLARRMPPGIKEAIVRVATR